MPLWKQLIENARFMQRLLPGMPPLEFTEKMMMRAWNPDAVGLPKGLN